MENNNSSSNSSVCTKIRQAFASSSALRAMQRILSLNQEHKHVTNGSNYPPKADSVQTKPHHKAAAAPDHDVHHGTTTGGKNESVYVEGWVKELNPYSNIHRNKIRRDKKVDENDSNSSSDSERATKVSAKSELPQAQHVPKKQVLQNGSQHGKESVDNYSFKDIIERISKKEIIEHDKKEPDAVNNANIHRDKIRRAKKVDQKHNSGWKKKLRI